MRPGRSPGVCVALVPRPRRCSVGPDLGRPVAPSAARSPALSTTQVATFRRSSSVACSSIRRARVVAGTPRASSRSSRVSSGASTTITASYSKPRFDSTSSGTSWTTTPPGRRLGDPAQELLADRRVRDRLELLAGLVVDERDARRARAGRATRRAAGSRARTARRAWRASASPARRPRARSRSASTTTAPRAASSAATVDFPDADPARQPHHQQPRRLATDPACPRCRRSRSVRSARRPDRHAVQRVARRWFRSRLESRHPHRPAAQTRGRRAFVVFVAHFTGATREVVHPYDRSSPTRARPASGSCGSIS